MTISLKTASALAQVARMCTCVFARTTTGVPTWKEGERILETRCGRCIALGDFVAEGGTLPDNLSYTKVART